MSSVIGILFLSFLIVALISARSKMGKSPRNYTEERSGEIAFFLPTACPSDSRKSRIIYICGAATTHHHYNVDSHRAA